MTNLFKEYYKMRLMYRDMNDYESPSSILTQDIHKLLTPIEYNVWVLLRAKGMLFYPQYPIKNYYVDFASPMHKVCIEVDGKFHTRPIRMKKDLYRQIEIESLGWEIFRISGVDTYNIKKLKL